MCVCMCVCVCVCVCACNMHAVWRPLRQCLVCVRLCRPTHTMCVLICLYALRCASCKVHVHPESYTQAPLELLDSDSNTVALDLHAHLESNRKPAPHMLFHHMLAGPLA